MTTFGLHLTSYPVPEVGGSIAAYTRDVAAAAEGSGVFSALWLTDHVHNIGPGGPAAPMPESHLVLASIAACTQELSLGLLATSVVYRNPALLAKMITTIDVLSGGRAILGIGAGHPRTQAEAVGVEQHHRQRVRHGPRLARPTNAVQHVLPGGPRQRRRSSKGLRGRGGGGRGAEPGERLYGPLRGYLHAQVGPVQHRLHRGDGSRHAALRLR